MTMETVAAVSAEEIERLRGMTKPGGIVWVAERRRMHPDISFVLGALPRLVAELECLRARLAPEKDRQP